MWVVQPKAWNTGAMDNISLLLMCFVHIFYIPTLTTHHSYENLKYLINSPVNCELVILVTSFRLADNRKSAQKGRKSKKIFVVLLMY